MSSTHFTLNSASTIRRAKILDAVINNLVHKVNVQKRKVNEEEVERKDEPKNCKD